MKTVSIIIYEYAELPEKAKARAASLLQARALDYNWWEFVCEDVDEVARLMGITIDRESTRRKSVLGNLAPLISFRGFSSQGDGASFTGLYEAKGDCGRRTRSYAPLDEVLHAIADEFDRVYEVHGASLQAHISRASHHYSHENTVDIDVTCIGEGDDEPVSVVLETKVQELLRRFMRWIYARLEEEHDYLLSDEQLTEFAAANHYWFDATGRDARDYVEADILNV